MSVSVPDYTPSEILRYGAYVSFAIPEPARDRIASAPVPALVQRLGLHNEFERGAPGGSYAFLRRADATPSNDAMIHVGSETAAPVEEFCREIAQLLAPATNVQVYRGVVRPTSFTGSAMHEFAYAHQVTQQPGELMPNAFFVPLSKTQEWWAKTWMERHTYFLPRYDEAGGILNEGHALAAAAGIPCLYRRTYRHEATPAPEGYYDFLNYFECSDDAVPTFHAVCAALRDVRRNPEWKFVKEGPTWSGRRVATWAELF
jgi:hypothetical protein